MNIAQPRFTRMIMQPRLADEALRRHGAPESLGQPVKAIGWFDPGRGALRMLVAVYAGGQRATLRKRRRGASLMIDEAQP